MKYKAKENFHRTANFQLYIFFNIYNDELFWTVNSRCQCRSLLSISRARGTDTPGVIFTFPVNFGGLQLLKI